MAQLTATVSDVEVSGGIVLAMVRGLGGLGKQSRHILAEHGLDRPEPTQWYSHDDLLEVFEAITANAGPFANFNMGTRVADDAEFHAETDSVEEALLQIDAYYRSSHRGTNAGGYTFEKTDENSGTIVCNTPYPCDFDRGFVETIVQKYRPQTSWNVTVKHDETAACKKRGGDSCTYVVRW